MFLILNLKILSLYSTNILVKQHEIMTTNYQDKELLNQTAKKLASLDSQKNVLIGFDAFIDEIIHMVDKRYDENSFDRIPTIEAFGKRIINASGMSTNIEMVPKTIKLGGNGALNAMALIEQSHKITFIGNLGYPNISDVFKDLADKCERVISVTDPGHTHAVEFDDGKILLGKLYSLPDVNWKNILKHIDHNELKNILKSTNLLSVNNWTMISHMNGIINGLFSIIEGLDNKPGMFIDLADPQKRTEKDIKEILNILSYIGKKIDVIFSMNKKESIDMAEIIGIVENDTIERAQKMREKLGVSHLVIHPLQGAAVATKDWVGYVAGPYTAKPKLTTGAGDNFNAGFCSGYLQGFTPEECLVLGVNTSGYYVRNATSPDKKQLIDFMLERSKKIS